MSGQSLAQERQELQAQVDYWAGEIVRWSGVAKDARDGAAGVRAGAADGALSLDDLAAGLTLHSGRAEVADEAALTAGTRLGDARRALLAFDVDDLGRQSARLSAKLAAHEKRTAELLAPLIEHEGVGEFVHAGSVEFARDRLQGSGASGLTVRTNAAAGSWKSDEMRRELRRLEVQADVGRDALAGVDPDVRLRQLASPLDGRVHGLATADFYLPSVRDFLAAGELVSA